MSEWRGLGGMVEVENLGGLKLQYENNIMLLQAVWVDRCFGTHLSGHPQCCLSLHLQLGAAGWHCSCGQHHRGHARADSQLVAAHGQLCSAGHHSCGHQLCVAAGINIDSKSIG